MLKKTYLEAPVFSFADFNKVFHLETDVSKLGLGAVLSQKQTDGGYHPIAYMRKSLTVHEYNYFSTKHDFLELKSVILEQFQEYLLWKPFIVKTDNNLLTYIMTTPNLDVTGHCWVKSLTGFTFSIEYQKGWHNAAADALSQVTMRLDAETVKSILDEVTMGLTGRVDVQDPVVGETDEEIHKQVWEAAVLVRTTHIHVKLQLTDCAAAQQEDPVLKTVINWIPNWKVQDLKHLLGEDTNTEKEMVILQEWRKLMPCQGTLYHHHMPASKLEEVMWCVVPMAY